MVKIDLSDIPETTPEIMKTTRVRKNPYYEGLMKNGFSIRIRYTAEEASEMSKKICNRPDELFELDEEELEALERYSKAQQA